MATAASQLLGLSQVLGSLQSLTGKSQTTTGSQTTQTDVSAEGIQRIINQMLAGPGGVRDVSGAARGAGLYNSTTELQNLNDLNTRVAGEAARLSAPTTTTSQQTIEQPGIGLGGLAPIAALAGISQLGNIGSAVSGLLGGSSGSAGVTASPNFISTGNALNALSPITASAAPAIGSNALSSLADLTPAISGGATTVAQTAGADSLAASLGGYLGEGVPIAGNFLSGLLGGDAAKDPMNLAISSLAAVPALGPAGLIAAPLAVLGGSLFGDISIVCTALQARGLLDKEKYAKGQTYLKKLHRYTKLGYYWLASGWAKKIDEGDIATIAKCLPWAYSRTELISAPSFINHIKYFRGTLTKFIGQPLCFCIGAVLSVSGKSAEDYLNNSVVN